MAISKRDYTTKEERERLVISKGHNQNKNKLSDYLSQPNVKAFNSIVVDTNFKKIRANLNGKGRPQLFKSREECQNEIEGYFKLCYDYDMIPTVASMSLYLGCNKDTIYDHINNPSSDYSDLLKNAVSTCLAYQESGVMSNEVPAVPFIFLGKQYYGFKDTQDVNILATNQIQNTANTINAIREQISNENENNLPSYKE